VYPLNTRSTEGFSKRNPECSALDFFLLSVTWNVGMFVMELAHRAGAA